MSLFGASKEKNAESPVPVLNFDLSRRYDLYCRVVSEERIYENIQVIGVRTFDRITQFSSGAIGGLLEIEGANGARMMIPQHGVQMICEHGTQPTFKVLRRFPMPEVENGTKGEK